MKRKVEKTRREDKRGQKDGVRTERECKDREDGENEADGGIQEPREDEERNGRECEE